MAAAALAVAGVEAVPQYRLGRAPGTDSVRAPDPRVLHRRSCRGTSRPYRPTLLLRRVRYRRSARPLPAYARATPCPVLTARMLLRQASPRLYEIPVPGLARAANALREARYWPSVCWYVLSGTGLAYVLCTTVCGHGRAELACSAMRSELACGGGSARVLRERGPDVRGSARVLRREEEEEEQGGACVAPG
eukprot:3940929-Rhodomonas_salina.2